MSNNRRLVRWSITPVVKKKMASENILVIVSKSKEHHRIPPEDHWHWQMNTELPQDRKVHRKWGKPKCQQCLSANEKITADCCFLSIFLCIFFKKVYIQYLLTIIIFLISRSLFSSQHAELPLLLLLEIISFINTKFSSPHFQKNIKLRHMLTVRY